MSSVVRVPQTCLMRPEDLSAADARTTLLEYGRLPLLHHAFLRFRYGDGFTSSRALGLQLLLALIPLGIAFVGLTNVLHADQAGAALREILLRITPGTTDEVVRQTLRDGMAASDERGLIALVAGLAVAGAALTTAMGQVERGANRIYGIQRDRPAREKYARATLLALTAGVLMLVGFLVVVVGDTVGEVLAHTYGWGGTGVRVWELLRFPVGFGLTLGSYGLLIEHSPRRRQPGWQWISIGAATGVALWLLFTYLLSLYVTSAETFGSTYGPLTGIVALVLWANLTSVALFLGIAFCAQLEAAHAGVLEAESGDPEA